MFQVLFYAPFYADCVPLYFADPANHKASDCLIPDGEGQFRKIGKVTIEKMAEQFGSESGRSFYGHRTVYLSGVL